MIKQNKMRALRIVLLILVTVGLLLYAMFSFLSISNTSEQPIKNGKLGTVQGVDTSDWLVYENKEYGYRFKYPKNLKVLDGKDPQLDFLEPPKKTVYIMLSAKYPNIKSLDIKNPDSFLDVKIGISPIGTPEQYGKTVDQIVQHFEGPAVPLKRIFTIHDATVVVYKDGALAYFIANNIIYNMYLEGMNPKDKYTQDLLGEINNQELTEWTSNYPNYTHILEGIYSTFELLN